MSVVGASVIAFDPTTEFGSVARQASATTTNDITTTSLSDFMCFPPDDLSWVRLNRRKVAF
jgi:hypothetical protein